MALVLEELAGCISGTEQIDDQLNAKELGCTIRLFLDTLPERDQDIFLQRYFSLINQNLLQRDLG